VIASRQIPQPARRRRWEALGDWRLPLLLAAALCLLTLVPYLYAWLTEPHGRVFMGFFYLGDDANTYLAKMHQGYEGKWLWQNRYTTEPSPGIFFFTFWIALGHLAKLLSLSLLAVFQLSRLAGAFALLAVAWAFIVRFVEGRTARRWALWFMSVGLGCGYVIQALGHPIVLGQQTDTLDWRMPELSAFYSVLSLPHFAWVAAFQGAAIVLTLAAAERGQLRLGLLAGLAWLAEASIHAQMPILLWGALGVALVIRPVSPRGYLAALLAVAIALPYVAYSYVEFRASPEVLRWSAQWRNNLPPDVLSLSLALAPQLILAAFALPALIRRRSRDDVFLLAWLILLAAILWLPNPAGNLRRRFFDGIYMPLVVLAARGMFGAIVPRLRSLRGRRLLPFAWVAVSTIGSAFLIGAPLLYAHAAEYSLSSGEYRGLTWLSAQAPGAVLSTARMGLYIPAYSADSVYVGQYSETYNYEAKGRLAERALSGRTSAAALARSAHLNYVFWSAESGATPPTDLGVPAFRAPGVRIWRIS